MTLSSDIQAAQEVHHRLEFYLVAVAFTIAGFAIQTGKFTGNWVGDTAEVVSWLLITASGVIGLWRLEYIPVLYRVHDFLDRENADIGTYSDDPEHTDSVEILRKQVAEYEPKLRAMESGNHRKYFWQRILFVAGLCALLVARFTAQMSEWYW